MPTSFEDRATEPDLPTNDYPWGGLVEPFDAEMENELMNE